MNVPQFGQREPGRSYPDRPAAFAVMAREGRIALAHVSLKTGGIRIDLPGGGLEDGESASHGAVREYGEETGLVIEVEGEPFTLADHYFINDSNESHNTRGRFFAGTLLREDVARKIEHDHTLIWRTPHEALLELDRDSHVWALACWLRRERA